MKTGSFEISQLIDYLTSSNESAILADRAQLLQVLNIIFHDFVKAQDRSTMLATRRNEHYRVQGASAGGFDLGAGLRARRGYFTSVRFLAQNGENLATLARFVRGVRVDRLHLKRGKSKAAPAPNSLHGLATPKDGRQLMHPPKVPSLGATAKQIKSFVHGDAKQPSEPNSHTTGFKSSKRGQSHDIGL